MNVLKLPLITQLAAEENQTFPHISQAGVDWYQFSPADFYLNTRAGRFFSEPKLNNDKLGDRVESTDLEATFLHLYSSSNLELKRPLF